MGAKGKLGKGVTSKKLDPLKKAGKTKAKKKSWTKVKVKDKLNNDVFLDQKRFEKLSNEIPKILCVTRAILCEKFKINGSVARFLINHLVKENLLRPIGEQRNNFSLCRGVQA